MCRGARKRGLFARQDLPRAGLARPNHGSASDATATAHCAAQAIFDPYEVEQTRNVAERISCSSNTTGSDANTARFLRVYVGRQSCHHPS